MALITSELLTFPGIWRCRYWYPNTKHDGREDVSEYVVRIEHHNDAYIVHSLFDEGETPGSHLEARFTVDGSVATGTFMEDTSKSGDWQGMTYKGAFQLLLSEDHTHIEGQWVATGYNNGNPKTFTGRWELVHTDRV